MIVVKNRIMACSGSLFVFCTAKKQDSLGQVYNSPSPTSRAMTSLITSSIEIGGERKSHTKFGDDVTTTS